MMGVFLWYYKGMKYLSSIFQDKFLLLAAFFILLPSGFKLLCGVQGQVFLAHPQADDPNFDRTVLYMMKHNIDGAMALVINRSYPQSKKDKIPSSISERDIPVFWGGPVGNETDVYVLEFHEGEKPKITLFDKLVAEDIDILNKIEKSPDQYRIYMGAAEWQSMQYELERFADIWVLGVGRDKIFTEIFEAHRFDSKEIWLKALQDSDFYKRQAIKGSIRA